VRAGYPIHPNHNAQSSRCISPYCSMSRGRDSSKLRPNAVGSHRIV